MSHANAHQFSFRTLDGEDVSLSDYQGKVVLVVNTASQCGFTPQYADLQSIYERYKEQGLVVLGVPSDDFGGQELDSEAEVQTFTSDNYSITFPMTEINNVSGGNAHPFYKWAREKSGFLGSPKWNFHKYLIDKEGNFVDWYSSLTKPSESKVITKIEEELAK